MATLALASTAMVGVKRPFLRSPKLRLLPAAFRYWNPVARTRIPKTSRPWYSPLLPIGVAAKAFPFPPHRPGFKRVALGLRHRRQRFGKRPKNGCGHPTFARGSVADETDDSTQDYHPGQGHPSRKVPGGAKCQPPGKNGSPQRKRGARP